MHLKRHHDITDLEKSLPQKIFFSGIGGIGMSGLAHVLIKRGYKVAGSDIVENEHTKRLCRMGAKFYLGQKRRNLKDFSLLIVSAAIKEDNPEIIEAKKNNIAILRRSELLGLLMSEKKGIAIAGTHGKTTTSTMISLILEKAGLDPTIIIGGEVKNIGGGAKNGGGEYFVAEACEYERSFLDLHPYAAVVTNVEEDHLDTYDNLDCILESFGQFLSQINPRGFLVVYVQDENLKKILSCYSGKIISYGFNKGDFQASNIYTKGHHTYFEVRVKGHLLGKIKLNIPGDHNILNALAAISTALELGVPFVVIKQVLASFNGARRRFEIKGKREGILVIDDYAHHPTEIRATLEGLRSYYPYSRVWCVFQAHQYSRTHFLLSDFARSFRKVERVIIPEIYEARDTEEDKQLVNCQILASEINKISHNAVCIPKFQEVNEYLRENACRGDIIITIGAGPVYKIGESFLLD